MLKKFLTFGVVLTTIVWTMGVAAFVPVASAVTLGSGDVIKGSNPAVYYFGADGKRYLFPYKDVYKSWFGTDFSMVKTLTDAELVAIPMGGNVTIRPGKLAQLVDMETPWNVADPKVYAVEKGAILRWVASGSAAVSIWGAAWETFIYPIPEALLTNYTIGSDITLATDYNLVAQTAVSSVNEDKGLTGSTTGGLSVSLASDTPAAASVPAGIAAGNPATDVSFTKLNFVAGPSDVTITKLSIIRGGLSVDGDLAGVKLYDGTTQLGNTQTFNATHKAVFNLASTPIIIAANTTKSIMVKADLTAGATGIVKLGLATSYDVETTAAVGGTFPIYGNEMSEVATEVGQLGLADGSSQPTAGGTVDIDATGFRFFQVRMQANGTEDINVNSISLQKGAAATFLDADLTDVTLYNDTDSTTLGTATISGEKYNFNFSPVNIKKGSYKEFSLKATVVGGSGRIVAFDINDGVSWLVQAQGATYGYGVAYLAGAWVGGAGIGPATTINQGTLNVSKSLTSPATGNIPVGGTEIALATFDFAVRGEEVKIGTSGLVYTNSVGTDAGAVAEASNFRLVDASGSLLAGPVNPVADAVVDGIVLVPFTTNFILPVGENKLTVKFDLISTATPGRTHQVSTDFSAFANVRGLTSNKVIVPTPGVDVPANNMTAQGAAISADFAAVPVIANVIAGSKDYLFGELALNATAGGEDVKVTNVVINEAGAATAADYANCKLKNKANSEQVGLTVQPVGTTVTFTLSEPLIVSNSSVTTLQFTCDVLSTSAAPDTFTFNLTASAGGNSVDINTVGASTGSTVFETVVGTASPLQTVLATGTLKVTLAASTPAAKQLVASSTGNEVVKYEFIATDEEMDVTALNVFIGNTAAGGVTAVGIGSNLRYLTAYVDGVQVGSTVPVPASGYATINIAAGKFVVGLVDEKILTLKVDLYDKAQLATGVAAGSGAFQVGLAENGQNTDLDWGLVGEYKITATGHSSGLAIAAINSTGTHGVGGNEVLTITPAVVEIGDVFTINCQGQTISFTAAAATANSVAVGLNALWNANPTLAAIATSTLTGGGSPQILTAMAGTVNFNVTTTATDGGVANTQTMNWVITTGNGVINGGSNYTVHDGILTVTLNSSSPSGVQTPGTNKELMRFNLTAVNDKITINTLDFIPSETITAGLPAANGSVTVKSADGVTTYGSGLAANGDGADAAVAFGAGGSAWTITPTISAGDTLTLKYLGDTTGAVNTETLQITIGPGGVTAGGITYQANDAVAVNLTTTSGLPLTGNTLTY